MSTAATGARPKVAFGLQELQRPFRGLDFADRNEDGILSCIAPHAVHPESHRPVSLPGPITRKFPNTLPV